MLAKYSVKLGQNYEKNASNKWAKTSDITEEDDGYALQDESCKGYISSNANAPRSCLVAFSGLGYWDDAQCTSTAVSSQSCGTAGLKSEYANASNVAGKTGDYASIYPYVYKSEMSTVAPSYNYSTAANDQKWGMLQNNGYTAAYYVEIYVDKLKTIGDADSITGRLIKAEEATALSSAIRGNWSYLTGSVASRYLVVSIFAGNISTSTRIFNQGNTTLRPVITVSNSDLPE